MLLVLNIDSREVFFIFFSPQVKQALLFFYSPHLFRKKKHKSAKIIIRISYYSRSQITIAFSIWTVRSKYMNLIDQQMLARKFLCESRSVLIKLDS